MKTENRPAIQEVVVADLPESTTTSKQFSLPRTQTVCVCVFNYNCPKLPATLIEEGIRE